MSDLQIVMRTMNRGIAPSYLQRTIARCAAQLIPADRIHVFPTAPDVRWIDVKTRTRCTVHVPARTYTAPENMGVALSEAPACEWVIHLEDDIRPCLDVLPSMARWVATYMTADDRLASFFTPGHPELMQAVAHAGASSMSLPLTGWNSAVALAMRWEDAIACGAWITAQAPTWRLGQGFQRWAHLRGADKMIAAWHQHAYPQLPNALASVPCFVEHEGQVSSLRHLGSFKYVKAPIFTGQSWGLA